jgi:hypothetical protein
MSILVLVRCLNIALALVAVLINADKMVRYRLWRVIEMDALYRWMTMYGLLIAYALASTLATLAGVPVGVWTVIWTPPLIWAVISGFISRSLQPTQEDVRR